MSSAFVSLHSFVRSFVLGIQTGHIYIYMFLLRVFPVIPFWMANLVPSVMVRTCLPALLALPCLACRSGRACVRARALYIRNFMCMFRKFHVLQIACMSPASLFASFFSAPAPSSSTPALQRTPLLFP